VNKHNDGAVLFWVYRITIVLIAPWTSVIYYVSYFSSFLNFSSFAMIDLTMVFESKPFTTAFATDFASGLARHPFGGFIHHLSGGLVRRPSGGPDLTFLGNLLRSK